MKGQTEMIRAIGLSVILFIGSLSLVTAQSGSMADLSAEEKAQMLTEKQKERLSLSESQEATMYDLNLKYALEMESIVAEGRSMSTLQKLQDMSSRKDKEVKEVLDKSQYKEYQKLKDEMKATFRERRNAGGAR